MVKWIVLSLLTSTLIGSNLCSASSTRTINEPSAEELQSPVSAIYIGYLLRCLDEPSNPYIYEPDKLFKPKDIKTIPVWIGVRYIDCTVDFDISYK